jgi:hypothetical protein
VLETLRAIRTRLQIIAVRRRATVHRLFPAPLAVGGEPPRVLAVLTHVGDPERPEAGVARLTATLDGLLESLGDTRLELVVNALKGRHVVGSVPPHLRERVAVREREGIEPLFLGFEAQEEFAARADEFDSSRTTSSSPTSSCSRSSPSSTRPHPRMPSSSRTATSSQPAARCASTCSASAAPRRTGRSTASR